MDLVLRWSNRSTKAISYAEDGQDLAENIAYATGSKWDVVPTKTGTFTFIDSDTKKTIGTAEFKPAVAPLGGTVFVVGQQKPG